MALKRFIKVFIQLSFLVHAIICTVDMCVDPNSIPVNIGWVVVLGFGYLIFYK